MAQKEIWQTHEFEDFKFKKRYQISNLGRVMSSIDSPKKDGIILKQKEIKGVKAIGLKFYNTSKSYFIHKLVAMHFCKQPSPEHCYVIHLDQNKSNNKASNLKWVTFKESVAHTKKDPNTLSTAQRNILNTGKFGKVLTEKKVLQLKEAIFDPNRTLTLKQLAKKFGISEMTLYRIKKGELWYTVRVEGEPKNKKLKQYKKVKKERKAINKRLKHVTT
ncbi:MAG: HNH endonuclease [Sphingobacteriaceae bacterium]|jgi:predicted DNA-binding transcriptional regulator AlpA